MTTDFVFLFVSSPEEYVSIFITEFIAVIHPVITTGNREGLHLCWTVREPKVSLVPPHTEQSPLPAVHKHQYLPETPSALRLPLTAVSRVSQGKMMDGQSFISIRMEPTEYFQQLY